MVLHSFFIQSLLHSQFFAQLYMIYIVLWLNFVEYLSKLIHVFYTLFVSITVDNWFLLKCNFDKIYRNNINLMYIEMNIWWNIYLFIFGICFIPSRDFSYVWGFGVLGTQRRPAQLLHFLIEFCPLHPLTLHLISWWSPSAWFNLWYINYCV